VAGHFFPTILPSARTPIMRYLPEQERTYA
jgi:hypothetical protein